MSTDRKLYLSGDIDEVIVGDIINQIITINNEDDELEVTYANYTRQPIELYISSFGGSAYDGFALCDIIQSSDTPVYTIGMGKIMSAALSIFVVGDQRLAYPSTIFMYHGVSSYMGDYANIKQLSNELETCGYLQQMYDDIILNNSQFSMDQLHKYKETQKDYYFGVDVAYKYGLCDVVLYPQNHNNKGE